MNATKFTFLLIAIISFAMGMIVNLDTDETETVTVEIPAFDYEKAHLEVLYGIEEKLEWLASEVEELNDKFKVVKHD